MGELAIPSFSEISMGWYDVDIASWSTPRKGLSDVLTNFVTAQAKRYDVTPVMTFDQPLYWKAMMIIRYQPHDSDLKCMVLRLGGFHMQMSFLGSIGHLMADSGLHKLLEIAYTVSYMLTGKAVSRAVRGHLVVYAALNTILAADTYNVPVPTKQEDDDSEAVGVLKNPEQVR